MRLNADDRPIIENTLKVPREPPCIVEGASWRLWKRTTKHQPFARLHPRGGCAPSVRRMRDQCPARAKAACLE